MIDTRELRIGNIILFQGEPVKVMGIHTGTVLLDGVMRLAATFQLSKVVFITLAER